MTGSLDEKQGAEPATNVIPELESDSDKVVEEFGRKLYLASTDLQHDFAIHMTTVSVGFFTIYFALMKFLGLETLIGGKSSSSCALAVVAILPPIILVLTVVCFVMGTFPIRGNLSLDDVSSIKKARMHLINRRSRLTFLGMSLFSAALLITAYVAILALEGS